jgi:hypothetical protein
MRLMAVPMPRLRIVWCRKLASSARPSSMGSSMTWPRSWPSTMTPRCSPSASTPSSQRAMRSVAGGSPCAPRFGSNARYMASSAARSSPRRRRTDERPAGPVDERRGQREHGATVRTQPPAGDQRQAAVAHRVHRPAVGECPPPPYATCVGSIRRSQQRPGHAPCPPRPRRSRSQSAGTYHRRGPRRTAPPRPVPMPGAPRYGWRSRRHRWPGSARRSAVGHVAHQRTSSG